MEHYDPSSHLQYWGGSKAGLSHLGVNPFGENIFRVVYAPSRRSIVRQSKKREVWMRTYPQAGVAWVLEKWLSAYEFAKCTEEVWNSTQVGVLGAYPSRGEYELLHVFYPGPSSLGHIIQMITLNEAGKKYSANENAVSLRDDAQREETSDRKKRLDKIRDLLPAFGASAMSGLRGGRGTKTFDFPLNAAEQLLPVKSGIVTQRRGTKKYDVSHLIEA